MIPIISNSNCDFVNLQFGKFEEDLKYIQTKFGINIKTIKEVDNYSDLDGLAALINCLDLVISIQNSNFCCLLETVWSHHRNVGP